MPNHVANHTVTDRRAFRHLTVTSRAKISQRLSRSRDSSRATVEKPDEVTEASSMIDEMEISRRTWTAAIKLAVVLSLIIAALGAVTWSQIGDLPRLVIVIPVMLIAFAASWIQTERIHRRAASEFSLIPVVPARQQAA